jgi:hypothetical protein
MRIPAGAFASGVRRSHRHLGAGRRDSGDACDGRFAGDENGRAR